MILDDVCPMDGRRHRLQEEELIGRQESRCEAIMTLLTGAAKRRKAEEERAEFNLELQLPLGTYWRRRHSTKMSEMSKNWECA